MIDIVFPLIGIALGTWLICLILKDLNTLKNTNDKFVIMNIAKRNTCSLVCFIIVYLLEFISRFILNIIC